MASRTIKVTGVPDDLLKLLDEKIRDQHARGRAEYIRELIRRDVLEGRGRKLVSGPSFREILSPVHEESRARGYGEEELDSLFEEVRAEARQEKASRST